MDTTTLPSVARIFCWKKRHAASSSAIDVRASMVGGVSGWRDAQLLDEMTDVASPPTVIESQSAIRHRVFTTLQAYLMLYTLHFA